MTDDAITVPWIGVSISPADRVLRVVIAQGASRGQPYAGAYIAIAGEDGSFRVAHRFEGGADAALDDLAGLTMVESALFAGRLERSMRAAPSLRVLGDPALGIAALAALAEAEPRQGPA